MGSIVFRCPNCEGTEVRYDYSSKMIICRRCGTLLKDFERDARELVFQEGIDDQPKRSRS